MTAYADTAKQRQSAADARFFERTKLRRKGSGAVTTDLAEERQLSLSRAQSLAWSVEIVLAPFSSFIPNEASNLYTCPFLLAIDYTFARLSVKQRNACFTRGSNTLYAASAQVNRVLTNHRSFKEETMLMPESTEESALPLMLAAEKCPPHLRAAVRACEARYRTSFRSIHIFSDALLERLHANSPLACENVGTIATEMGSSIISSRVRELTSLANGEWSESVAESYLAALCDIYENLPGEPALLACRERTLCIAPEREGRIIAQRLGWLNASRCITPQAKRMTFDGGLAVGMDITLPEGDYDHCMIVDGAIASGATLMSIFQHVAGRCGRVTVFSAHCAPTALPALSRFAAAARLDIQVVVGHASGILNSKYYAVDPTAGFHVIVGDMGDMVDGARI